MSQLLSLIGTRPQYIKLKPLYDKCIELGIQHRVVDTGQHYDPKMSSDIMKDLGLEIVCNAVPYQDKFQWLTSTILSLRDEVQKHNDLKVLLYGDTDSAFCAALVCSKLDVPFGHIEAGVRCGNRMVPEEVNRMFIDSVATVNFCTAPRNLENIEGGVLVGDLEYELLNNMDPVVRCENFAVMTMHRKENMVRARVQEVFDFVASLDVEVKLAAHHSLTKKPWFKDLQVPPNLSIGDPLPYTAMVKQLAHCKFILTDSGSIPKTAPFFGKRCLVLRNELGWIETVEAGFSKTAVLDAADREWLEQPIQRQRHFYSTVGSASQRIIDTILADC